MTGFTLGWYWVTLRSFFLPNEGVQIEFFTLVLGFTKYRFLDNSNDKDFLFRNPYRVTSVLTVFRLLLFVSKLPNFCRFSAVSEVKRGKIAMLSFILELHHYVVNHVYISWSKINMFKKTRVKRERITRSSTNTLCSRSFLGHSVCCLVPTPFPSDIDTHCIELQLVMWPHKSVKFWKEK